MSKFLNLTTIGLLMNFIGALNLTIVSFWGTEARFGGPIELKGFFWKLLFYPGWILLVLGFFLQIIGKIKN